MKQILLASIAALTLSATIVACKKTETAPTTKATPNLQSVTKPYVGHAANYTITGIKQEPEWHLVTEWSGTGHVILGYHWEWDGPGHCHGTGACLTSVTTTPVPIVISGPDDTGNIKQIDLSSPSVDFFGGSLFETGDADYPYMFIFKKGVSNMDEYFSNPAAVVMGNWPIQWSNALGGYKEIIKAATRTGRILNLTDADGVVRQYMEVFVSKEDIDDKNATW